MKKKIIRHYETKENGEKELVAYEVKLQFPEQTSSRLVMPKDIDEAWVEESLEYLKLSLKIEASEILDTYKKLLESIFIEQKIPELKENMIKREKQLTELEEKVNQVALKMKEIMCPICEDTKAIVKCVQCDTFVCDLCHVILSDSILCENCENDMK